MLFHSIYVHPPGDASRCWTIIRIVILFVLLVEVAYKRSSQPASQQEGIRTANGASHKTAIIIVAGAHFAHNGIQIWTINLATQINLLFNFNLKLYV